jgi:Leucine-rich repeat (LRR) protein
MDQGWLDSLSEDWESQPRSSGSPVPSLLSLTDTASESSAALQASRIPKYNPEKKTWSAQAGNNNSPLGERNLNENNVPLSIRSKNPSKLRQEVPTSNNDKSNTRRRTLSDSTTQSSQYGTIQRKADVSSPEKGMNETPEWKRRLLQGDVAYGEQKDLFTAAGLEDMFRPPPTTNSTVPINLPTCSTEESSVVMPSSPPPYILRRTQSEEGYSGEGQAHPQDPVERQPRGIKYKMMDDRSSRFSSDDMSRSSSFQPRPSTVPGIRDENTLDSTPAKPEPAVIQNRFPVHVAGRVISGQSDFRNEELSPIYMSRQNTVSGSIGFVAGLPNSVSQKKLNDLREDTDEPNMEEFTESSQLVLDDDSADTEDYAHNGKFVNMRRGGRSEEGSFQKRMLSPSSLPAIDESELLPEESMQASTPKNLAFVKKTRSSNTNQNPASGTVLSPIPQTPEASPSKGKKSENSSGSPLKLFGTYDTFTNQTLLRRLSQFEKDSDGPEMLDGAGSVRKLSGFKDVSTSATKASKPREHNHSVIRPRKATSFGAGDLDSFQFSEEVSHMSDESNGQQTDMDENSLPPLKQEQLPTFKFQLEPSPALVKGDVGQQQTKHTTLTKSTKRTTIAHTTYSTRGDHETDPSQIIENLETPRKRVGDMDGKRLPRSPLKDPTPKRRRTLQESDLEASVNRHTEPENNSLGDTHQQMQSVIGKKRKDARHGDDQQAATPRVLAMRQMLRPRSPTPSQKFNQEMKRVAESGSAVVDREVLLQEEKLARIQAELDSNSFQNVNDGSRKPSLTTQDFLDEAKMIMGYIRTKAQPPSGLSSVEESETEAGRIPPGGEGDEGDSYEDSFQESTREPFSRPPSRDGAPVQRLPMKQADPELLNHLRKYQEKSDIDDLIASSIRTIAQAKASSESLKEEMKQQLLSGRKLVHDMIDNQTGETSEYLRKRKHSSSVSSNQNAEDVEYPSQGSNSSGQSTITSIPTGSSRGSDSRRIIAPHTVSHLIPEQVAGMVFDRERNIWVKRKSVSQESAKRSFLPSDDTDEDPFGDIPDLSVDETQELQRLKGIAAELKHTTDRLQQSHEKHRHIDNGNVSPIVLGTNSEVPVLATILEQTSVLKEQKSSTYDPATGVATNANFQELSLSSKEPPVIAEVVKKETSILRTRVESTPHSKRSVTITFSSPLTSVMPQHPEFDTSSQTSEEQHASEGSQDEGDSVIVRKSTSRKSSTSFKVRSSGSQKSSRHESLVSHKFSARPVSRIEERDEGSEESSGQSPDRSVSIVVATPMRTKRTSSLMVVTPRPSHEIGTLSLTPLSEFTIHQDDEELGLNVSYVANNKRHTHGTENQKTLSLVIKDLVGKLTEVEPYEPFWEHMKQVDLRDKNLSNLHKLDEFCENLEEIDASNNRISQLDGVTRSVRDLRISHNCLTDLTAWGHLSNLQYVDVSNNELESLSAFKHLYHLRSIRADNNMITSIDGIGQLDALLSLRVRGNLIESVNFKNTGLQKLTDLDLAGNLINKVSNLKDLKSLSDLNLDENKLDDFHQIASEVMTTVKYLRLNENELRDVDVSSFPNLRLLSLDRNHLGKIRGLLKTTHLDTLSLREQNGAEPLNTSFLSEAFEVRKLFLSGNLLDAFNPKARFLNLQYLELASCGLQALPSNLGHMICNTRILNLNYNALSGISSLAGIVRLRKLHLVGNRLTDAITDVETLSKWSNLTSIDMRSNPSTLGFYPPASDAVATTPAECDTSGLYTLARANAEKDVKYAKCLDMKTKMMRRVYEMMLLGGCHRVRVLDGLDADRKVLKMKDDVLDGLIKLGIVSAPAGGSERRRDGKSDTRRTEKDTKHREAADSVRSSRQGRADQAHICVSHRETSTAWQTISHTEQGGASHQSQRRASTRAERSVRGSKESVLSAKTPTQKLREKSAVWDAEDSFA